MKLPNVTLIALTSKDFEGHKKALDYSSRGIEFGDKKIIWDESIPNIDIWNYKIIYELPSYVKTDYCILIHADGYIINPELWSASWLDYDYIGAPWPLPKDDFSYRDEVGGLVRVGNSVSLRSKRLMEAVAESPKEYFWSFKDKYGNTNEDGFICCHNSERLRRLGLKIAPLEVAKYFSKEHEIEENKDIKTFAFHSL